VSRRLVGQAKGNDFYQVAEGGVLGVGGGVETSKAGQRSQPEVALALGRAYEVIPPQKLVPHHSHRPRDVPAALGLRAGAVQLEGLKVEGVVEVNHQHLVGRLQARDVLEDEALNNHDVTPIGQLGQAQLTTGLGRKAARLPLAHRGGGQHDDGQLA
jgi:hypothetical protein